MADVVSIVFLIAAVQTGLSCQAAGAAEGPGLNGIFDVRDYGAVGDGVALDTTAIQAAMDACARAGGGRVRLHNGAFLSGTLYLKSNVTLYVEAGAVLLGSTDLQDYPETVPAYRSYTDRYTDKSLIYAEQAENIAIMGRGLIDGQGGSFKDPDGPPAASFAGPRNLYKARHKARPYVMRIIECTNVMTKDLTFRNSAMWMQHYLACDGVVVDGISVHNRCNAQNNCLTIDSCHNVRVSNCEFSSTDDAFELKSTSNRPCKNVAVTNCILRTRSNALKLGTESNGGFQNVTISNCVIADARRAGIALELVDGGAFDRVTVSNITMQDVGTPIFIHLGNRARPFKEGMERPGMGSMQNITISNIQATGASRTGCSITGLPGFPVENVTLDNIRIRFAGDGSKQDALRDVPECAEDYPEDTMFGFLPAYGFYCRHASNVKMRHLDLGFEKEDHRPALVFEDVQDLDVFDLDAQAHPSALALIWLKHVDGAVIHGCRAPDTVTTFVRLDGNRSKDVTLMNNDLTKVQHVLEKANDVGENAVHLDKNLRAAT